jgi:hypothetical protein
MIETSRLLQNQASYARIRGDDAETSALDERVPVSLQNDRAASPPEVAGESDDVDGPLDNRQMTELSRLSQSPVFREVDETEAST